MNETFVTMAYILVWMPKTNELFGLITTRKKPIPATITVPLTGS